MDTRMSFHEVVRSQDNKKNNLIQDAVAMTSYFPSHLISVISIAIFFFWDYGVSIVGHGVNRMLLCFTERINNVFANMRTLISFHLLHAVLLARNIPQRSPEFKPLILQGVQPLNFIPACCRIVISQVSLCSALSTPYSIILPIEYRH